jgi:hypothetical protein
MLYLLWGLLNIVLIALFIVLCRRAVKLITGGYGTGFLTFFALWIFFTCNNNMGSNKAQAASNGVVFTSTNNLVVKYASVELADNPLHKLTFEIAYRLKDSVLVEPVKSWTFTEGASIGTEWEEGYSEVTRSGSKLHYRAHGTRVWSLMGFRLYNESLTFEGSIDLPRYVK